MLGACDENYVDLLHPVVPVAFGLRTLATGGDRHRIRQFVRHRTTSPSGDVTESTSPSGNSDSDSPTSDSGGVSDSQTDTGDTTAPTSAPTTVTDSDPMTATDTLTTDTTSPIDPSDSDSTSTSDSQGSDTDTSIGDTSSTGDTGTTVADDTTTSDDTTTTSDDTTGEPIDCGLTLKATIRDFQLSHPDMEDYCCGQVNGLVQNDLGGNDKPVFARSATRRCSPTPRPSTSGTPT
jgi:hypothetical protein